jgi:hypothetical protein
VPAVVVVNKLSCFCQKKTRNVLRCAGNLANCITSRQMEQYQQQSAAASGMKVTMPDAPQLKEVHMIPTVYHFRDNHACQYMGILKHPARLPFLKAVNSCTAV